MLKNVLDEDVLSYYMPSFYIFFRTHVDVMMA